MSRGVWDYVNDSTVAESYDTDLAGSPLLNADVQFVSRQLQRAIRILDLGCGTGRAAIALAHGGHEVTGIDLSQSMLEVAQGKVNACQLPIQLVRGNIVELSMFRDHVFDAAICLFSTLGMISGATARRQALAEAFRVLRPGGQLILHVHQLGHHLSTRAGRRLFAHDLIRRIVKRPDAGDFSMPARPGSPAWTMHVFTRREVVKLLRSVGYYIDVVSALNVDGKKCWPAWRAYGLLVAARKPSG